MSLCSYLNRIRRLDHLIRRKSTGTPGELAEKLDISERWLYKLLRELREELGCPIGYDYYRRSYVYKEKGRVVMEFEKTLSPEEKRMISGGNYRGDEPLYVFVQCDWATLIKDQY